MSSDILKLLLFSGISGVSRSIGSLGMFPQCLRLKCFEQVPVGRLKKFGESQLHCQLHIGIDHIVVTLRLNQFECGEDVLITNCITYSVPCNVDNNV